MHRRQIPLLLPLEVTPNIRAGLQLPAVGMLRSTVAFRTSVLVLVMVSQGLLQLVIVKQEGRELGIVNQTVCLLVFVPAEIPDQLKQGCAVTLWGLRIKWRCSSSQAFHTSMLCHECPYFLCGADSRSITIKRSSTGVASVNRLASVLHCQLPAAHASAKSAASTAAPAAVAPGRPPCSRTAESNPSSEEDGGKIEHIKMLPLEAVVHQQLSTCSQSRYVLRNMLPTGCQSVCAL